MNASRLCAIVAALSITAFTYGAAPATLQPDQNGATTGPATSRPAPPTLEGVKALVEAGNYKDGLKGAYALLHSPTATGTFNRHDAQMLLAECQFRLAQSIAAKSTLDAARKEAEAAGNADDSASAGALYFLIQKCTGHTYVPVTGKDHTALDVFETSGRSAAYGALFSDSFAVCDQKAKTAKSKTDYTLLMEVARDFPYIRCLDRVVHGKTKETDGFAKDVSKSAADIIDHTLADYEAKTYTIEKSADRWVKGDTTVVTVHDGPVRKHWEHRAGPDPSQVSTLNTIRHACMDMPGDIQKLSEIFGHPDTFTVGHHFRYWKDHRPDLSSAADDIKEHVDEVLNKNYSE